MAIDITINLNDEREATLVRLTDDFNKLHAWEPNYTPISPTQYLRRDVRDRIDLAAQQYADADKVTMREAYKLATPEEQATIDTILNKYRTTRIR